MFTRRFLFFALALVASLLLVGCEHSTSPEPVVEPPMNQFSEDFRAMVSPGLIADHNGLLLPLKNALENWDGKDVFFHSDNMLVLIAELFRFAPPLAQDPYIRLYPYRPGITIISAEYGDTKYDTLSVTVVHLMDTQGSGDRWTTITGDSLIFEAGFPDKNSRYALQIRQSGRQVDISRSLQPDGFPLGYMTGFLKGTMTPDSLFLTGTPTFGPPEKERWSLRGAVPERYSATGTVTRVMPNGTREEGTFRIFRKPS